MPKAVGGKASLSSKASAAPKTVGGGNVGSASKTSGAQTGNRTTPVNPTQTKARAPSANPPAANQRESGKNAPLASESRRDRPTAASGKPAAERKPKMITPEQALANTRALLQAKQEQAHQPTPYPTADPGHKVHGGFMSHGAAEANNERHHEEANSTAIHGHVAAQVRSEQGKRDKR